MHQRYPAFVCRGVRDGRQIHDFLHRTRGDKPEAGGSNRHDIGMIAEYRQGVSRHGSRGDMKNGRGQFPGDFKHVGDHQQEALGGGESRRQGAGRSGSMDGAGGAAFRLHFDHVGEGSPDIYFSLRRHGVGDLAHVG